MIERDQMKEYSDEQVAEFIKEYVERQCMSGTFPNFVLEASERLKNNVFTQKNNKEMEEKEKLDAIKREIERRIEQHSSAVVHGDYKDMDENTAYWNEDEAILDFINSLN